MKNWFVCVVTCCLLSGCSMFFDKQVQWETEKPETFPVLYATGYAPISLQQSDNETQRMLLAIQASKLAAYAELAEQVYGTRVTKNSTMSEMVIDNSELMASVDGLIRGAKVVRSYAVGDDTYATEVMVDFQDVYDLVVVSSRPKRIKDVKYY